MTVKLVNDDALPFNDVRHATFVVRDKPLILTLTDEPETAKMWTNAIRALALHPFRPGGGFDVKVKRPGDLDDKDLASRPRRLPVSSGRTRNRTCGKSSTPS